MLGTGLKKPLMDYTAVRNSDCSSIGILKLGLCWKAYSSGNSGKVQIKLTESSRYVTPRPPH